jgi:hypothetical protein
MVSAEQATGADGLPFRVFFVCFGIAVGRPPLTGDVRLLEPGDNVETTHNTARQTHE